jgi:hypothetical protein
MPRILAKIQGKGCFYVIFLLQNKSLWQKSAKEIPIQKNPSVQKVRGFFCIGIFKQL